MKSVFGPPAPRIAALCIIVCLGCLSLFAQDLDEVTISGRITDSNGDPVVGARILVTLASTGARRNAVSKANGRYSLIELLPGIYKLTVSATGFGDKQTDELTTISGQHFRLNFSLSPATVTAEQTINISEDNAPVIDTTRTVVGGTITQDEIEELPNTSNDVLDLVFTLGQTAEEPLSIRNLAGDDRIGKGSERDQPSGVIGAGSVSLAGGAAYSTNITIDGLDNNDDRLAQERFQPSIDSVAEVQVITNQFSAEYGRASGGRINIRTRAGARKFRGRFSMFFEDDGLNANTFNNNRRGLSRLPFTEYEPGGTLSGPVPFWYFKDRTFFFSSYSYRDRDATTQIFTALPLDQNPRFVLPAPTNPETARSDLNEPGSALIASYIARASTPQRRQRFTQRLDHNFTDNHNITINYQRGRSDGFRQYRETTRFLEETLQGRIRDNDSFYITDNYVVNSNVVNQVRFLYSDYRPNFATNNPLGPVVLLRLIDETLIGNPDRISGTVVVGNSTGNFARLRNEKRYQFQETANFVVGEFNLRFGADIQRIDSTNNELRDTTGTFNFENADGFLGNEVVRYRRNSGAVSELKNTYSGFFA
ncbi:MAG: TonB-dependent receptor, partial [Pyrinomonadaceae bacterium]|nr:TonB-dependent receptor [Pyrinomonadaceae bacterium]